MKTQPTLVQIEARKQALQATRNWPEGVHPSACSCQACWNYRKTASIQLTKESR